METLFSPSGPLMKVFDGSAGNRIVADEAGEPDAPVVLYLHGGGQTRHSWKRAVVATAARGFRVYALDSRGHGDSEWTNGRYAISDLSNDVRAVIRQIGRPVALVGASMGGLASLQALADDPDLPCYALVLVDIVPRPSENGTAHIMAFMTGNPDGFDSIEQAGDAVANYLPNRPRPARSAQLMKNLRLRNGRYYWHWDPTLLSDGGPLFESAGEMERALRETAIPTLLVRGENSDLVTFDQIKALQDAAPNTEILDVAGAAHMVAGDRNDAFVSAVLTFLERVAHGP